VTRPAAGALAAALAVALTGCGRAEPEADVDRLVLYSPHSDEVRQEFSAAFKAWYQTLAGRDVRLEWPDAGGTSQILKRIQDKFAHERYDVDVVFGGGPIFERMKQMGFLDPCPLPDAVLQGIPKTVAGQPLYDPDLCWYGAAISTFGLIFNRELIQQRNLPLPESWDVMADPRYLGLVGAGDPSKSGSVRKAYEIILQAYGYEKGMAILVSMGANAREFYSSSSDIPRNCAQGFIAVGPCIDFYAQRQMRSEGGERLRFVAPKGLTVVNCDPIAILRNAPHPDVARRFVEFVMSPHGQRLWMFPPGTPGGPAQFAIERLAARPDVYRELADAGHPCPTDPFAMPPADFYNADVENDRLAVMPDYLRVALVENHGPLKNAWEAVIRIPAPEREPLVARLVQPLVSEDEMRRLGRDVWTPLTPPDDATEAQRDTLQRREEERRRNMSAMLAEWSRTLRQRYQNLAEEARAAHL